MVRRSYLFGDDECISYEILQALLEPAVLLGAVYESDFGGVVKQIRRFEKGVLCIPDDGRWQGIKREKICDLMSLWVLKRNTGRVALASNGH